MEGLLEAGRQFLEAEGWPIVESEIPDSLQTAYKGRNGEFGCFLHSREVENQLIFYSICPIVIPEDERLLIAEFLTRVNHGMPFGNFEIDLDSGVVRYKTSLATDEVIPIGISLVRPLVFSNVFIMDEYLPGIADVIEYRHSPVDAATLVERMFRKDALND